MAQDNDEINEARRKAMRNGEEDPVTVAQRYLNIYRQMHIFSPERKAAFDKMLLEVPPNIRTILASLPGGLMLQDYIGDLLEKQGGTVVDAEQSPSSNKPILETVLEKNNLAQEQIQTQPQSQPQVQPQIVQPVPVIQGGNMEISLGKDFAEQFAGAFDALLKKQNDLHNQSLEKISADLNRGQQELAQYLSKNQENEQKIFVAIAKALENRQIQPQPAVEGGELKSDQSSIVQQLIEGQKEINLRLSKMETTALNHSNENNQDLINALIKSNTEAMQQFASMQQSSVSSISSVNAVPVADNTEHLLNLIEQSQAKLIEGVAQRILQNNITQGQNQTSNNANNIQINTPDTSAQTLMLVNKIADLQQSNEKNMEEAIGRLIEAQKEIYTSMEANRSQEIAEAIVKGLQSSNLTLNNYVPVQSYNKVAVAPEIPSSPPIIKSEEFDENTVSDNNELPEIEPVAKKSKKKKKKKKNKNADDAALNNVQDDTSQYYAEPDDYNNTQYSSEDNDAAPTDIKPRGWDESFSDSVSETEQKNVTDLSEEKAENEVQKDEKINNNLQTNSTALSDLAQKGFKISDNTVSDNADIVNQVNVQLQSSGDDWGFGSGEEVTDTFTNNYEPQEDNNNYEEVEIIGPDSYIYTDDLSKQSDYSNNEPIIYDSSHPQLKIVPQIYDDDDEEKDPYVK